MNGPDLAGEGEGDEGGDVAVAEGVVGPLEEPEPVVRVELPELQLPQRPAPGARLECSGNGEKVVGHHAFGERTTTLGGFPLTGVVGEQIWRGVAWRAVGMQMRECFWRGNRKSGGISRHGCCRQTTLVGTPEGWEIPFPVGPGGSILWGLGLLAELAQMMTPYPPNGWWGKKHRTGGNNNPGGNGSSK